MHFTISGFTKIKAPSTARLSLNTVMICNARQKYRLTWLLSLLLENTLFF